MSPAHLVLWVLLGLATGPAVAQQEQEQILWSETGVVIAGVLEWQDAAYGDFSKAKRQDKELGKAFAALGVPADRLVVLLDKKAKHLAILETIERVAAATPEGGTFVFYYDGHGARLDDGRIAFASSDIRNEREAETGLLLDDVSAAIARSFKGKRVLFLADCCHSGGLVDVATSLRKKGLEAIALTSSEASNASTGEWTYTIALIDAFRGRDLCDHDQDGQIELGELNVEVREAMLHRELQRSGFSPGETSPDLVLAPARKEPRARSPKGFTVGQYARRGDEAIVRIVGEKNREALVETLDYATRTIDEIDPADLTKLELESFPVGTDLKVVWEERCWDAQVVRADGPFHWITYPGWDHYWDEWVADDRIISGKEICPDAK